MSLFIGSLAFEHASFDAPIRLGVLTGSILSAVIGFLVLRFAPIENDGANQLDVSRNAERE